MKTSSHRRDALISAGATGPETCSGTHRPGTHRSSDPVTERSSQLISWDDLLGQR